MFADATYVKGRVNGRVVSRAVVVATGVTANGDREVLGVDGRRQRGRRLLDRVPPGPASPRPERRAAGHLRPPPRPEGRDRVGVHRRRLATLPGALHAQRAGPGPEGLRRDGRRRDPHDLRPARRRPRPSPARRGHLACSTGQFPDVADDARRRRRGPAGLHRVPPGPLAQDLVDQPARAAQRRDQTTHQRRRHLPQRRLGRSGSSPPSSSRPTTNGPSPNAATSPKNPWPRSTPSPPTRHPPRRRPWPSPPEQHCQRRALTPTSTYTTPRGVIAWGSAGRAGAPRTRFQLGGGVRRPVPSRARPPVDRHPSEHTSASSAPSDVT